MIIIIFFGHLTIKQVFKIRYLGFYLDNNSSWEKHCSVIGAKMARGLGILRRVKQLFHSRLKKNTVVFIGLAISFINIKGSRFRKIKTFD